MPSCREGSSSVFKGDESSESDHNYIIYHPTIMFDKAFFLILPCATKKPGHKKKQKCIWYAFFLVSWSLIPLTPRPNNSTLIVIDRSICVGIGVGNADMAL